MLVFISPHELVICIPVIFFLHLIRVFVPLNLARVFFGFLYVNFVAVKICYGLGWGFNFELNTIL